MVTLRYGVLCFVAVFCGECLSVFMYVRFVVFCVCGCRGVARVCIAYWCALWCCVCLQRGVVFCLLVIVHVGLLCKVCMYGVCGVETCLLYLCVDV